LRKQPVFAATTKRERKGQRGNRLDAWLSEVITMLAADTTLPARYKDHPLTGDWKDFRDCHIRPVLVLIYRKPDDKTLQLVRLGSHSELGL
jgi:mRNA interferase YafQ